MIMNKFDELQMLYKVKAGKSVYLDAPGPEDARVLDEDEKELEERMHLKKGKRGPVFWNDPYAMATAALIEEGTCSGGDPTGPPWGSGDFARGSKCAALRDAMAQQIASKGSGKGKSRKKRSGVTSLPLAAMQKAVDELSFDQNIRNILKDGCGCTEDIDVEKVSDSLSSLMSAAAGWALSGDLTRGKDKHLEREWDLHNRERLERERREEERKQLRRRGMKKSHDFLVSNNFLTKEHSMVPPRQGLLWDAVKHRWTRPENVGHTVTEVQGSKRFRGVGTGVHERKVGGHGSGSVRRQQAGRRFRAETDVGRLRPHETSHKSRPSVKQHGHKNAHLALLREHRNKNRRK
jgi:hypothetical protein